MFFKLGGRDPRVGPKQVQRGLQDVFSGLDATKLNVTRLTKLRKFWKFAKTFEARKVSLDKKRFEEY